MNMFLLHKSKGVTGIGLLLRTVTGLVEGYLTSRPA